MEEEPKKRANYLQLSDFFLLENWCEQVARMYNEYPYLVGSSATQPNWRDVDVRLMLPDEMFDLLFPFQKSDWNHLHPRLRFLNLAMSVWGQKVTGLPIDFQFQQNSEANRLYGGRYRSALGINPALDRSIWNKE